MVAIFSINTWLFCPFCLTMQRYEISVAVYEFFRQLFFIFFNFFWRTHDLLQCCSCCSSIEPTHTSKKKFYNYIYIYIYNYRVIFRPFKHPFFNCNNCNNCYRRSAGSAVYVIRLSVQRNSRFAVKRLFLWQWLRGGSPTTSEVERNGSLTTWTTASDGQGYPSPSWQRTPCSCCWQQSYATSTSSSWAGLTRKPSDWKSAAGSRPSFSSSSACLPNGGADRKI